MKTSSTRIIKVLAQNYELCNIGNDIYMSNLREVVRTAANGGVSFSERPLFRNYLLNRSLKDLGKLSFPDHKLIDCFSSLIDSYDLVILSGPLVSGTPSKDFRSFLELLKTKNIPYCLLSAGSYRYDEEEVSLFSNLFEQYPPLGFSSRDDYTYEKYKHFAKLSLKSVCASFFSPITFPRAKSNSIVGCWDDNGKYSYKDLCGIIETAGMKELTRYRPIIDPFALGNIAKRKIAMSPIPCLVSPSYHDYLDYYSQTDLMVSSRVHCCAPTIAYGGKAVLVNTTGRKRLFDAIGVDRERISGISQDIFSVNPDTIKHRYSEMLSFVRRILACL
jgi:hypothetical protein